MNALVARDLSVRFGAFLALDGVSLTLPVGARHAIIGPNGAGKTTLVQALSGAIPPTSGGVELAGEDVTRRTMAERVARGLVRTFQINQLFPALTALENVCIPIQEREGSARVFWRAAGDRRTVEEAQALLAFARLGDVAQEPARELAYGQRRLLEIAIALAARPKALILDEPAAGVPSTESEAIFERLDALPSELALLFIEHDMNLVFRFARRITVLAGGRVLTEGTPAEIAADARVREVYLGRRGAHGAA